MSILPSQTHKGRSSSSSSSSPQNPHFDHGISPSSHNQQLHQLQLPFSGPESSMANSISGSVASSNRSSKKMTEHGNSSDGNTSRSHSINSSVGFHFVAEGVGSPQSAGEASSSPPNSRSSGSARRRSQMVNGNYLLNFQYNPISRPQQRAPPRKPQKIKPYNRDLFLQANYKFVVLDSGNYTLESMDPDKMLQWEDIICVTYSTPQPVQCPICLDDPLCPQITSCGHIFCFPCILQYLLMGEDNHKAECWRKCPLCFVMISSKDLYTIHIENVREHNVGDTLEFMLLTRRKDSFSLHEKVKGDTISKTHDPFSKFILTLDVDLSVREAMLALDNWLAHADSGLVDDLEKLPFVCVAMEQLKQRKKYWNAHKNSSSNTSCKFIDCKAVIDESPNCQAITPQHGSLSPIDDSLKEMDNLMVDVVHEVNGLVQSFVSDVSLEGQEALSSSYDDNKNLLSQANIYRDSKERNSYSFYQAVDGQPIVLHPLNMKCLLHHYGSYDLLPTRVSGKILQLESVTQSEAMRKRYRYLSHFPLTTAFQLCEIDFREFVPADALSPFMDEIKKREKQRKMLAKKEQEDREKAEAVAAYSLPVPYDFVHGSSDSPLTFSMDDFEALGSSTTTAVSSPPVHGGRQLFANVARLGFAAGCDSPSPSRQNVGRNSTSAYNGPAQAQGALSFANVISRERSTEITGTQTTNEAAKKVKKQSRVLLSNAGGRRY